MSEPLIRVRDLSVSFPVRARGAWPWEPARQLQAVQRVSFDLAAGQTIGIVGESGSGKSTLARAVVGTIARSEGAVWWRGRDLNTLVDESYRAEIQMIFQDPLAALNPRMTVGDIIAEPLRTHRPQMDRGQVAEKVAEIMERVGLQRDLRNRYPHEFSGGQCQRIGIARALILDPQLVVCDEPVSALDVSVQAQVINLLKELQRERGLSLIFIAHDLAVVRHISDEIMVMYLGRAVEQAPADRLIHKPQHPYTKALIGAAPIPDPAVERARQVPILEGELPSPMAPPSGCVFRTRCPVAVGACAREIPDFRPIADRHRVACGRVI